MGEWLLSRRASRSSGVSGRRLEGQADRSLARSAWESVPRKSRPVGYGMNGAQLIPEVFLVTNHTVPYGTGLFSHDSRHFVPGYYHL
jgi:hypothetical protein